MGVDLGTYRGRIGTFKFAFGNDVVTVNCYINFSRGLKTISVVTFIGVLFLLASTDTWSIQKEHATAILATNSQQPGSVWFVDMLLLMAGIEPNPGPVLCDKIFSMLIVVVVFLAMIYVMTYTDTSQSTKVFSVCVALIIIAVIYIQGSMNGTTTLVKNLKEQGSLLTSQRITAQDEMPSQPEEIDVINLGENFLYEIENSSADNATEIGQGSVSKSQMMNAKDERTSQPNASDVVNSDEQLPYESEHGSKNDATETGQSMNSEDEMTSQPKKTNMVNSDEHLPHETEHDSNKNCTVTSRNVKDESSVSKRQRMNAEDERTSQPKKSDVVNADAKLLNETEHSIKDNETETAENRASVSQGMNAEDEGTSHPIKGHVIASDKQLHFETENENNDKRTETSSNVEGHDSVSLGQRMIAEDEKTSQPKKSDMVNSDEQLPHETEHASNKNCTVTENGNECRMFFKILNKLELADKYPGKISMRDIMEADSYELKEQENQCISFVNIPLLFLKRLISVHSECRDIKVAKDDNCVINSDLENTMFFMLEMSDESQDISSLDIINVVFQCLDPFMKQVFFQKSYLCKIAVPLLYKQWETNESYKTKLSVWPLRSLVIDNMGFETKGAIQSKEIDILQLKTNVLAFSRFGRPRYSKSKLINSLLTNQRCDTFFNFDCLSGTTQRYLSNGQIEMFWLPTIGDKKDRYHDAVTFLNMRGDISEHFEQYVLSFITTFVDMFVILIDVETLLTQSDKVKLILTQFSSVIMIIADPLNGENVQSIQSFQKDVYASKSGIILKILSTHKGDVEQNVVDMVESMLKYIQKHLNDTKTQSYQQRLMSAKFAKIETDEDDEICQKGKNEAYSLLCQMKDVIPETWKQVLTPVHCKFSQHLGKLMKDREREKTFSEGDNIDKKIKTIREKQTQSITKTVKLFIEILIRNENSHLVVYYFLCWLNFHIESKKREILPQLMFEYRSAWEKLKMLKSKDNQGESELADQETVISDLERKIYEASFTVEHFFREIGHIYEAISELQSSTTKLGLPELKDIAKVIGRLVADGHQFEVIDGESFYMPYLWTKSVLQEVDKCIGSRKVMTLSVLGLQSSGKSTLLNTMFGSQFFTRTGRCTRGIHAQLVPAKFARLEHKLSPFSFVLVIDTEGLRSPELSHVQYEHDNELATVITGIGDITMLNVMGENTSEIRDILQVIVHAFLRLKMTNPKLDLRKSCAFIHQNVADTSASEKMISGLRKLMQTLDEMTKESARSEGMSEITSFNQVIEFDINSQVWYLKNLWQGNPPMAKVNSEYSERVVDMKCQILNQALNMNDKSYKSLSDIVDQAHSLWKGVLNEDFVFSFRNSLEIKAYMEMERLVQDQLWHLESFVRDELIKITQSSFANCNQKYNLQSVADKLIYELSDVLADEKSKTEEVIKTYFEKNKYKDIIIQWKHSQQCRINSLCLTLKQIIRQQIEKSQEKRSVEILTVSSHERHEEELRKKSMDVANEYKGKTLSEKRKNELFDEIWQSFKTKVVSTTSISETTRTPVKIIFERCLQDLFHNHHAVIKDALIKSEHLTPMPNLKILKGSFTKSDINDKDISLTFVQKGKKLFRITDSMKHIVTRVNQIFELVDNRILQLCNVNDEITEMAINRLMRELHTSLHEILNGNTKYNLQVPFFAKIYVYVSRYAHPVFEKHNENYFRTQGTVARLEQYKQQQKICFEAHLCSRQSEDIVAKLFSHIIEGFANECTLERLSNKITDELHSHLPSVKNRVIVEICSDLLKENDFDKFIRYIHAPKEYASLWVTERVNIYLFVSESKVYARTAHSLLNQIFKDVEESLSVLKTDFIGKSPPSIETWINKFLESMKKANISIPLERFRNLKKEIKYIQNVEYLTNEILANLTVSCDKMSTAFSKHESSSVKWVNSNPIERIIEKIWGCPEQCPFCGEPCAKNENHEGSVHYSIQHRPSCCKGTYKESSGMACIESCEFDIQSKTSHTCGVINYICNEGNRKRCSKEEHEYRNYKIFFPNWDIPPTSNMHDTSKFWMWFVATYKQDLQKRYDYKFDKIPTSWSDISKQQANESLMKTYTA